ncbi:MAG: hypothetical protein FWD05_03670 [Oscillospiraceae bacterium]|nr:hypothetical protein [Oscillospiraceae bacterium]
MLSKKIKAKAKELGYVKCGIIPATVFDEHFREMDNRSNLFPNSKKYYDTYKEWTSVPENSKSIIVCSQRYNRYQVPKELEAFYGKMYLFDNRISYCDEGRVNTEFETFLKILGLEVFGGTIPDRWAGAKAGVGKFGHNNFLYDETHGSYIIVNTWAVDKELEYDDIPEDTNLAACSDECHLCIKACPTKALSEKFVMDAGKCICRVQFDVNDALTDEMKEGMETWLYGCDACQDVCPKNKDKFVETLEYPLLAEFGEFMSLESVLAMNEDTYKNVVNPRFWYAGEESLWLWKCNAIRCMVNSGDSKYHELIKQSCNNEDKRISEMAEWGCKKLRI